MRTAIICAVLALTTPTASAQNIAFPQAVRLENVRVDGDTKVVTMGNFQQRYSLFCKVDAAGCITPKWGKKYLLQLDSRTSSESPGAKEFIASPAVQGLIALLKNEKRNVVLVPEDGGKASDRGMFLFDARAAGVTIRMEGVD